MHDKDYHMHQPQAVHQLLNNAANFQVHAALSNSRLMHDDRSWQTYAAALKTITSATGVHLANT